MAALTKQPSRLRAELARQPHDERTPIAIGDWVVVADRDYVRPLELGIVASGPEYTHLDDHAIDDVWTLRDGAMRSGQDLTPFDFAAVLEDSARLLADLRLCRRVDEIEMLRVHRFACLARRMAVLPLWSRSVVDHDQLSALILVDAAIAAAEEISGDLIRRQLPNLCHALYLAGALAAARVDNWDSEAPHPWLRDLPGISRRQL